MATRKYKFTTGSRVVFLTACSIFFFHVFPSNAAPSSSEIASKQTVDNITKGIVGKNVPKLLEDAERFSQEFHNSKSYSLFTEVANTCFERINSGDSSENDYIFFVRAQTNRIRLNLRDSNFEEAETLIRNLQKFVENIPLTQISKKAIIRLKASVYWEAGDVQFALGNYEKAIAYYDLPFKIDSTGILQIEEKDQLFLNRRATFLTRKAVAVKRLSNLEHCLAYLSNSLTTADTLIMWYPTLSDGYEIKAEILREKGLTQFELNNFEQSLKTLKEAVSLYRTAQKMNSRNLEIQNKLGEALGLSGYLNLKRGNLKTGKTLLSNSLSVLDVAIKAADNQTGRVYRAQTFKYEGITNLEKGSFDLADISFKRALNDIQFVQARNPEDYLASKLKLQTLILIGELREKQNETSEALQAYEAALDAVKNFKTMETELARGVLFRKLASFYDESNDFKNRDLCINNSIKAFETVSKIATKKSSVYLELGITLSQMGSYSSINHQLSLDSFNRANSFFEKAISLLPSSIEAHYERAKLVYKLAEALDTIPGSIEALRQYSVALGELNQVIALDSKFSLDEHMLQKLIGKRKEYLHRLSRR